MGGVQGLTCSRWSSSRLQGLYQDGDIILGGLFSLHYKPPDRDTDFTQLPKHRLCTGLERFSLEQIYVLMLAIEEINGSPTLLPGVKLGYHIFDSCGRNPWSLQATLALVSGNTESCFATEDGGGGEQSNIRPASLIIGGASSGTTMVLAMILSPLHVPLISHISSCPCLSDRRKFPTFFRTIPSDIYQARIFAQLVIHFNWSWIGAVMADNDYGHLALKVFREETRKAGVCLAFVELVRRPSIAADSTRSSLTIQASTAKVTDRLFLASEALSTSVDLLQNPATAQVARGALGVAIRSSIIPGFADFLKNLNPLNRPDDVYLREFWELEFGCSPQPLNLSTSLPPCNGTETLGDLGKHFSDISQLRVTYNVYLAVYAAAHALHKLLSCPDIEDQSKNKTCDSPANITHIEVLQHLSEVNFTTPQGEILHFDGADIPAKYDIINWQDAAEGRLKLVIAGRVDGVNLNLDKSAIQWPSKQIPTSVCSEICPPGTRKADRKGEPLCCFDCIPCGDGEISELSGSLECERCPPEFWSSVDRTGCVPRQLDFLSFNETLGITLTTVAASGVIVTSGVFVVFLWHRHTPLVRANNSELSFLLLLSLKLCFLCSLVFIGRPSVWACRFQQAAFGISFVLCVSCLQVKTVVVLTAFRSARPGAEALIRWFGPNQQRGSVCFLTGVQVVICIVWLSLTPPEPRSDLKSAGLKVTLECAMSSVVGFSLVLGYIGLLACSCLVLAFLARKLPDNFNEAKLITFSMLIFCAVWVAFVPAYVSSPGKYSNAVEIFAILASSYGLLFCIFAPKCFIILLRPERNTKKHLMHK
ncbi:extracellular calcium-sensing receptor-like [Synchiropus picturatus]